MRGKGSNWREGCLAGGRGERLVGVGGSWHIGAQGPCGRCAYRRLRQQAYSKQWREAGTSSGVGCPPGGRACIRSFVLAVGCSSAAPRQPGAARPPAYVRALCARALAAPGLRARSGRGLCGAALLALSLLGHALEQGEEGLVVVAARWKRGEKGGRRMRGRRIGGRQGRAGGGSDPCRSLRSTGEPASQPAKLLTPAGSGPPPQPSPPQSAITKSHPSPGGASPRRLVQALHQVAHTLLSKAHR